MHLTKQLRSRVAVRLVPVVVLTAVLASACTGAAVSADGAGRSVAHGGQTGPRGVVDPGWTTFDQNGLRTGVDASGASLSPATAAWTSPVLDGSLYGQPLLDTGRVFAATEHDTVYALAADTGSVLWSSHVGTPFDPSTVSGLCGNINPTIGITSTPVIDTARSEIFVVATEQTAGGASHHLVGLDIYTGTVLLDEVVDPAGWSPRHSSCSVRRLPSRTDG